MAIRLLLAGSQRLEIEAWSDVLDAEPDLVVVGTAASAAEARTLVALDPPDVAVIDSLLGPDDAVALAGWMTKLERSTLAVVLLPEEDADAALRATLAGAAGVLVKPVGMWEVASVARGVVAGGTYIPPRLLTGILGSLRSRVATTWPIEQLAQLTPRELEVLRAMSEGRDTAAIAEHLYLSPLTVRTHVKHILAKLGVHSSVEAVSLALGGGRLHPRPR